jgi:hypothetical protein
VSAEGCPWERACRSPRSEQWTCEFSDGSGVDHSDKQTRWLQQIHYLSLRWLSPHGIVSVDGAEIEC